MLLPPRLHAVASRRATYTKFLTDPYGWVGQHQKGIDNAVVSLPLIEMGARPYLPEWGRFLSVDPVEGGNPNDYVYPVDPINGFDLTGEFDFGNFLEIVVTVVTVVSLFTCTICAVGLAVYGLVQAGRAFARGDVSDGLWELAGVASFGAGRLIARGAKWVKESQRLAKATKRAIQRGRAKAGAIARDARHASTQASRYRVARAVHRYGELGMFGITLSRNMRDRVYGW